MHQLNEKGCREGLAGLNDVDRAVGHMLSLAEQKLSEAEAELNAARQIKGFVRIHREAMLARLAVLEAEKEKT